MANFGSYALFGGTAVKIAPLEVSEPGTTYADEGCAFNPVVCDVSGRKRNHPSKRGNDAYPKREQYRLFVCRSYN